MLGRPAGAGVSTRSLTCASARYGASEEEAGDA